MAKAHHFSDRGKGVAEKSLLGVAGFATHYFSLGGNNFV